MGEDIVSLIKCKVVKMFSVFTPVDVTESECKQKKGRKSSKSDIKSSQSDSGVLKHPTHLAKSQMTHRLPLSTSAKEYAGILCRHSMPAS